MDETSEHIYELRIYDHVPFVNPADYGLADKVAGIDPADYFVTSGDAVQKAGFLERELWAAAGAARAAIGQRTDRKAQEFLSAIWAAAGRARSLVNKLKQVRGDAVFLETEWSNHKLYCIPKNPRPRADDD